MINITNIKFGWLDLNIGNKTFCVSYLTNVCEEIEKIFNLDNYKNNYTLLYFEGEGRELYLSVRREYNQVIIIWEEYDEEDILILCKIQFNFEEFKIEWLKLWNNIQKDYFENFTII